VLHDCPKNTIEEWVEPKSENQEDLVELPA